MITVADHPLTDLSPAACSVVGGGATIPRDIEAAVSVLRYSFVPFSVTWVRGRGVLAPDPQLMLSRDSFIVSSVCVLATRTKQQCQELNFDLNVSLVCYGNGTVHSITPLDFSVMYLF